MTNRTRELVDFAHTEPMAIEDFVLMLRVMDEEEIGHVEQIAHNLLDALARMEERFEDTAAEL